MSVSRSLFKVQLTTALGRILRTWNVEADDEGHACEASRWPLPIDFVRTVAGSSPVFREGTLVEGLNNRGETVQGTVYVHLRDRGVVIVRDVNDASHICREDAVRAT
jgi:hypothetical protein